MILLPRKICLSGGGIKGLAHIGALEALDSKGLLRNVKEYIGISAGAICAFAMCVGCGLPELRRLIEQLDFGKLRDIEPETLFQFPELYGIDTGDNLARFVVAFLKARMLPVDLTFADLAARHVGPQLRVYATDLHTCRVVEFSAATTPDAAVVVALRASMCVPLYFQPVVDPVSGHLLVDGGVICHTPLKFLKEEERAEALSIGFSDEHKPVSEIASFWDYARQLYYALDYEYDRELTEQNRERTILLKCGRFSSLDFELGLDERKELMEVGRAGVESFLEGPRQPSPLKRRHSVS